jgi:class 3 adenylate cyclase
LRIREFAQERAVAYEDILSNDAIEELHPELRSQTSAASDVADSIRSEPVVVTGKESSESLHAADESGVSHPPAHPALPTTTQTVLFTDVADYTASVARTDREGLRKILAQHESTVRPIVEAYGGRIVKNIGDSFLCLFSAATDALRAALEIQAERPSEESLLMRIAITTGDVELIDGDAFGESVNLAARILSKTPAGEIWFGTATRYCMNTAEVAWESVGWFRLKGIPGEQQCFRVVPENKVWLPHTVIVAAEEDNLVRIAAGSPKPDIPPDPVVLFEGFEPNSDELAEVMESLPVLDPASLFLAAYKIAPEDRHGWTDVASGLVIGMPEAIDKAIHSLTHPESRNDEGIGIDGSDTILLDRIVRTDLELVLAGIALPSVPLAEVVAGYTYDLLPDRNWVTRSDKAIARVEVTTGKVILNALCNEISVAGAMIRSGDSIELTNQVTISTPAGPVQFCPTKSGYVGLMLIDSDSKLGLKNSQIAEIGRRPNPPGLAFPNREGQDNIRWCSGSRASKARRDDFSLDRVLAGRQQASIKPTSSGIELTPLHEECATFVFREGRIGRAKRPVRVRIGDMIVAGTSVVALRAP